MFSTIVLEKCRGHVIRGTERPRFEFSMGQQEAVKHTASHFSSKWIAFFKSRKVKAAI